MNKTIIFAVIALILVVLVGYLVFNYYQSQKLVVPMVQPLLNSEINANQPIQPVNLPANLNENPVSGTVNVNVNLNQANLNIVPPPAPLTIKMINIANFAFSPKILTIKAGTEVNWTNNDQAPHQIAGDTFGSQTLNTGDSYAFIFSQAGTYNYHCAIHPFMTGQIVVTQ